MGLEKLLGSARNQIILGTILAGTLATAFFTFNPAKKEEKPALVSTQQSKRTHTGSAPIIDFGPGKYLRIFHGQHPYNPGPDRIWFEMMPEGHYFEANQLIGLALKYLQRPANVFDGQPDALIHLDDEPYSHYLDINAQTHEVREIDVR